MDAVGVVGGAFVHEAVPCVDGVLLGEGDGFGSTVLVRGVAVFEFDIEFLDDVPSHIARSALYAEVAHVDIRDIYVAADAATFFEWGPLLVFAHVAVYIVAAVAYHGAIVEFVYQFALVVAAHDD